MYCAQCRDEEKPICILTGHCVCLRTAEVNIEHNNCDTYTNQSQKKKKEKKRD